MPNIGQVFSLYMAPVHPAV